MNKRNKFITVAFPLTIVAILCSWQYSRRHLIAKWDETDFRSYNSTMIYQLSEYLKDSLNLPNAERLESYLNNTVNDAEYVHKNSPTYTKNDILYNDSVALIYNRGILKSKVSPKINSDERAKIHWLSAINPFYTINITTIKLSDIYLNSINTPIFNSPNNLSEISSLFRTSIRVSDSLFYKEVYKIKNRGQ